MTKRILERFQWFGLATLALPVALAALTDSEWRHTQDVAIDEPGLTRLVLPPATLDAARSDRGDLRLLDPDGREIPFLFVEPVPEPTAVIEPDDIDVVITREATVITVTTGTRLPLESITLRTPAATFLKSVTIEISSDGSTWETLATGQPFFRRSGVARLSLKLADRPAAWVRCTLDDARHDPVPITDARLVVSARTHPTSVPLAFPAAIVRREEFAGETVLTLDPGARHLSLLKMELGTPEPLFTRNVTVAVREFRDGEAVERPLARGTLFRFPSDESAGAEALTLELDARAPSRELLLQIDNGDSPPLPITSVQFHVRPVYLLFNASDIGTYRLLSGHVQIPAPNYDLARMSSRLREAIGDAHAVVPGPLNDTPNYQAAVLLPEVPLIGAPLATAPWQYHRAVTISNDGVQELKLDLAVLANSRADLGDVRLSTGGNQVPYLMERTRLSRPTVLEGKMAPDDDRPSLSRWEFTLRHAHLPLRKVTLTTSTPLFQRDFVIYQRVTDARGYTRDHILSRFNWSRRPGDRATKTIEVGVNLTSETLIVETDNGDNPAIELGPFHVAFPVTRVLFKAAPGDAVTLHYGNNEATAPRYDLSLIANQLIGAHRTAASLAAPDDGADGTAAGLSGLRGGFIFWGTLGAIVIVLLVVIARLLPKPPPAT